MAKLMAMSRFFGKPLVAHFLAQQRYAAVHASTRAAAEHGYLEADFAVAGGNGAGVAMVAMHDQAATAAEGLVVVLKRNSTEPIAAMAAGCCSPLQYLEGAAYIAIVLAVLGVPQLLTYYLDQRNRRNERREDRAEAERIRQENLAEAERIRREERADAERVRREERADAERVRREERVESERRHQEMMTALIAIVERNGHTPPEQTAVVRELRQRINQLEAENARLRAGNSQNPPESDAAGATEQDISV